MTTMGDKMRIPKMILFDYGRTLIGEGGFESLEGERALFEHLSENPRGVTPEEASAFSGELFTSELCVREAGFEMHEHTRLRLKAVLLGIRYAISLTEAELLFWDTAAKGATTAGVEEMLDELKRRGIRSAVVSNISFSGEALKTRIDRLLPDNAFEFVVASSEYGVRKPSPLLFQAALRLASLSPGDVWFCGDQPRADIEGAHSVGMYPIWYMDETSIEPPDELHDTPPACAHKKIGKWSELTALLDRLQNEQAEMQEPRVQ